MLSQQIIRTNHVQKVSTVIVSHFLGAIADAYPRSGFSLGLMCLIFISGQLLQFRIVILEEL